jgi:hypothetical protein
MTNVDKLINFLTGNTHYYVSDVLCQIIITKNNDYHKLENETGLETQDLLNLLKYYDVLNERNVLDRIIGVGDDITWADEALAGALYCMNTNGFMEHFKENFTQDEINNAIWDPTYHPTTGFKQMEVTM